jgi:hypothetical protein
MSRFPFAFVALLPLTACDLEVSEVMLSGVVLDQPYFEGSPVEGVEVTALDGDLVEYSSATTDAVGRVEIPVAAAQDMFLELRGDGIAATLFAGEAGVFDLALSDGELFTMPASTAADLAAEFGACAGDGTGGVIEGEVRIWMPGEEFSDVSLVGNAWVAAYDEQNTEYLPCYLDENGEPAPEDQSLTNATGRFAIFGVPAGAYILEVAYRPGGTEDDTDESDLDAYYWYYKVHMVDDGVAPFHPAWVEFGG